ncbi:hypothetical protein N9C44_01040 [bacterium]|nr:hypothetical protein [bacterium]
MADIKNFGIKGIASDVQMGKSGGRLKYDSGNGRFDLTQSDGTTLEDLRLGTVAAGAWNGTVIGSQYGGTGQNFSSSTGIIKVSSGTMSAGSIDLTADVTGALPVANGGTGATDASGARTGLGLGNLSVQASNAVDIDGGAIDGTIIGANSAAAITGTIITASTKFVGALEGNSDTATALAAGQTIAMTGDVAYTSASFDGTGGVTGTSTLATVNSTVGTFGSTSAIPVVTVNAKGLVTAVTTASIVTSLTVDGDTGTQDVDLSADDLQFVGTANEIETAVTKVGNDVKVTLGLPNDVTIGNNLSVTGSFLSDDITAATVTINGNLTVTGTQTTTDSTVVTIADPLFQVGSDTNDNLDRGVTYLHNDGSAKTGFFGMDEGTGVFTYIPDATDSSSVITGSAGDVKFGAVEGTSFSDGTISGITFVDEDNMSSDSATKVPTQQSVKAYVDAAVTGQDLDFTADSGGALAIDLDSETLTIAGGTGLSSVGAGNGVTVNLDDTAVTAASYGSATAVATFTVDAQGRLTAAGEASITTSLTIQSDDAADNVVALASDKLKLLGGTGITSSNTADDVTFTLDDTAVTAASYGSATAIPTFTVDAQGRLTAAGEASISSDLTIGADSGTDDTIRIGTDKLEVSGTANETTTTVSNNTITVGLASSVSGLTSVSATTLTDGTASINAGALTGVTDVTASGTVQYGSLSDGTITITGFADEDTMSSDSATLVPTQQSVKAYVDSVATAADLDFQGDSGGALSIDLDSETLDIAGGTNITTAGSSNTLTVNLDATLTSMTAATFSGQVQAGTFTDGTASLNAGALSGVTDLTTSGDAIIGGNLTVSGTTTSVNSTNTTIADTLIVLQSGLSGSNPNDIGHIYERGTDGNNGFFGWDQSADKFVAATTTADGSTAGDLTLTAADFEAAAITGTNITGSGTVQFGSLSDGVVTATAFQTTVTDSDTLIPTGGAVVDYVLNNGGDGLLLRSAITTGATTAAIGTVPNVSSRTYYADKVVVKVSTGFSGNSVNYITIKENAGSGTTIVAQADADISTAGTYIIELDGSITLTKNAAVTLAFFDASDNAVAPSAGAAVASVHYNWA